jgi:hypothetical protein
MMSRCHMQFVSWPWLMLMRVMTLVASQCRRDMKPSSKMAAGSSVLPNEKATLKMSINRRLAEFVSTQTDGEPHFGHRFRVLPA